MIIRKRILASILALTMIMSSASIVRAENEDTDAVNVGYELLNTEEADAPDEKVPEVVSKRQEAVSEEVKTLVSALGILDEAEMALNDFVTRAFAAEVVVRLAGFEATGNPSGTFYKDVDTETQYAYSIELATDMGYFKGIGDGYFSPDSNITDNQMASVLLRFAGYDSEGNLGGAYSKIRKRVNISDDLTYYDLANMIYNLVNLGSVQLKYMSDSGITYEIDEDNTILNSIFSAYEIKGIVTCNGDTGLYYPTDIDEDEVKISTPDGYSVIKVGETKISGEIGKKVKAYYKTDGITDDEICISYKIEGADGVTEISLNDFDAYATESNKLHYYVGEKEKKLLYDPGAAIIYNGHYYSDAGFSWTMLDNMEGMILAIDNNSDGKADVFNITAYVAKMVKSVILSTNTINFTDGNSICLDDDNFDRFSIVDADGIKAYLEDFDDMTAVCIATTCATAKKRFARVIVSTQTVSGVIVNVENDEVGHTVLTLENGEKYRSFDETFFDTGKSVKMFITSLGNVAKILMATDGEFMFGLLASVKYDKKSDKLNIRILNSSNKHEDAVVSEKLRIDGISCKTPYQMYDLLAGDNAPSKYDIGSTSFAELHCYPIRYRYRTDGTLLEIDTPKRSTSENDNTLKWMGSASALESKNGMLNNYVLGFETPTRPSTLFFSVSASEEANDGNGWGYKWTEEAFNDTAYTSVDKASNLASKYNTRNVRYFAYKCSGESEFADMVVTIGGPGGPSNTNSLFMYDRSVAAYDEEREETVTKLIGYLNGVKTEVTVMPEYADSISLKQGDVITYGTDSLGRLSRIRKIIDHTGVNLLSLQTVAEANDNDNFNRARTGDQRKLAASMIFGYVLKRKNDLILLKNINWGTNIVINRAAAVASLNPPSTDEAWIKIPASTPVTVYDPSKTDPVYAGTYDEIIEGTNKSVIGIRYGSNTTIQEIVVLNE